MSKKYILSLALVTSLGLTASASISTIDPDIQSRIENSYKAVDDKFREIDSDLQLNSLETSKKVAQGGYDHDKTGYTLFTRTGTVLASTGSDHPHGIVNISNLQTESGKNISEFLRTATPGQTQSILIDEGDSAGKEKVIRLQIRRSSDQKFIMMAKKEISKEVDFPKNFKDLEVALSKGK